ASPGLGAPGPCRRTSKTNGTELDTIVLLCGEDGVASGLDWSCHDAWSLSPPGVSDCGGGLQVATRVVRWPGHADDPSEHRDCAADGCHPGRPCTTEHALMYQCP